jgi:uncharacterized membrane protein
MAPEARIHLARSHITLAVLTLLLAAAALVFPSGASASPKPDFQQAAWILRTTATAYLLLAAAYQWQRAARLRQIEQGAPRPALLALLGHFWVLWVAGAALWRGSQSRALLAGCDPVLAALVTASLLALGLMIWEWRQRRLSRNRQGDLVADRSPGWISFLTGIAGWLVVLALWYIETIPLTGE